MRTRFLHATAAVLWVMLAVEGCWDSDDPSTAPKQADLEIHAVPTEVKPLSDATIAVIARSDCKPEECSILVSLMPPTPGVHVGSLYAPAGGTSASPSTCLRFDARATNEAPLTLIYRASDQERDEVITAALFRGRADCRSEPGGADPDAGNASTEIATATVRVAVTNASTVDAGGQETTSPADAGVDSSQAASDASPGDGAEEQSIPDEASEGGSEPEADSAVEADAAVSDAQGETGQ